MKKRIVNELKFNSKSFNELESNLKINKNDLKKELDSLVKEKKLMITKNNRYGLMRKFKEGTISVSFKGFGFIKDESDPENPIEYFVSPSSKKDAWNGDLVKYFVIPNNDKSKNDEAKVVVIVKRANEKIYGVIRKNGTFLDFYNLKDFINLRVKYRIKNRKDFNLKAGQIVIGKIESFSYGIISIFIEKIIGDEKDVDIAFNKVISQFNIKNSFDKNVKKEIDFWNNNKEVKLDKNRIDLTDRNFVTIDGSDSKDLDDAIFVKKENDDFFVSIAIADVSHYVKEKSSIDEEAFLRGTSIYLINKVVPMLPRILSNNLCSLNPNSKKYALVLDIIVDVNGNMKSYKFHNAVIESKKRLTYDLVQQVIDGKEVDLESDIKDMLLLSNEVSDILREIKLKKGMIEFDYPESKIILDENDIPTAIIQKSQIKSEQLIENLMVLANETVAGAIESKKIPNIYRIHNKPRLEKITNFLSEMNNFNISLKDLSNSNFDNKSIQGFNESISNDHPMKAIITSLLLKTMEKAIYSNENIGHFGLGLKKYTHFTSPIRRYPDLIAHRIIKKIFINNDNVEKEKFNAYLSNSCTHLSTKEQEAVDAEREYQSIKKSEYASNFENKVMNAEIISVLKFGFFVQTNSLIEGLISTRNQDELKSCEFNDIKKTFVCDDGKEYKLGDKIKVRIKKIYKFIGKIDFEVAFE